jgi:hypothetical protein
MGELAKSTFPENLDGRVGCAAAPLVIDVRGSDAFPAATALIVGAKAVAS